LKTIVIIPTLNEEKNIKKIVNRVVKANSKYNILIIDDESSDNTIGVIKKNFKKNKKIKLISRKKNKGLGSAHRDGLLYSYKKKYDYCVTIDADGTHDPEKIKVMLDKLKKNSSIHIINTSRFMKSESLEDWPMSRKLLTYVRYYLVKILLNSKLDSSGGFRAYKLSKIKKKHLLKAKNHNYFFLIESLYYFEKLNYNIVDIPIKLKFRNADQSKMKIEHILDSFFSIVKLSLQKFNG